MNICLVCGSEVADADTAVIAMEISLTMGGDLLEMVQRYEPRVERIPASHLNELATDMGENVCFPCWQEAGRDILRRAIHAMQFEFHTPTGTYRPVFDYTNQEETDD